MKRVVTVQDFSGFGKCALSIALPVFAAAGIETAALPAMLLAAHTGYGEMERLDTAGFSQRALARWAQIGFAADLVHIGYLGSAGALRLAQEAAAHFAPAPIVVDPAMADHGRLYRGIDADFPNAIRSLCRRAGYLLPNLTEAALLLNLPADTALEPREALEALRERYGCCVVLTGVGDAPGATGAAGLDADGRMFYAAAPATGGHFHGTGDLFAACFSAGITRGKTPEAAANIAVDFVAKTVALTAKTGRDTREGLIFEPLLIHLAQALAE